MTRYTFNKRTFDNCLVTVKAASCKSRSGVALWHKEGYWHEREIERVQNQQKKVTSTTTSTACIRTCMHILR